MIATDEICQVNLVYSHNQLANFLTKKGASSKGLMVHLHNLKFRGLIGNFRIFCLINILKLENKFSDFRESKSTIDSRLFLL